RFCQSNTRGRVHIELTFGRGFATAVPHGGGLTARVVRRGCGACGASAASGGPPGGSCDCVADGRGALGPWNG
ncbi:hypothetical protein PIB30_112301, partial [Stylosanthes scabra]|nr:hypothetical protein [Stylosanthes scabra]